jgi:hypothetical protein
MFLDCIHCFAILLTVSFGSFFVFLPLLDMFSLRGWHGFSWVGGLGGSFYLLVFSLDGDG